MADLRATILEHTDDYKADVHPVPTPEWPEADGKVGVRKMGADEVDEYEWSLMVVDEDGNVTRDMRGMRAKLVTRAAVYADSGERIFRDGDEKHVGQLRSDVVKRLWNAARKLNAIAEDAGEEAEGNSEPDQSDGG